MARLGYPNLGYGVGLRTPHFSTILRERPAVDFFEIISENFMDSDGLPRQTLDKIAARYPIVMHGVSLSIGSTDPLNREYLRKLKVLAERVQARWISDHLCWTQVGGHNSHDLLPLPYTEESLAHVIGRVQAVQEFLGQPLVLENPSVYVSFAQQDMDEPTFLRRLCAATGCGLLLDVNNVYVCAINLGFDPQAYVRALPLEHVVQFHVAGHTNKGKYLIDTHDQPVIEPVWQLYRLAAELCGGASTLLEWDAHIPAFPELITELNKARAHVPAYASPLKDLQQEMLATIAGATQLEPPRTFIDTPAISAALGVSIYRHAYIERLLDCLRQEYPALLALLGDESFAVFARPYIVAYPPSSYTLADFGAHFALFLKETQPPAADDFVRVVIELAELERSLFEMFDRQGERQHQFAFPVHDCVRSWRRGEAVTLPAARPTALRVYRWGTTVRIRELT